MSELKCYTAMALFHPYSNYEIKKTMKLMNNVILIQTGMAAQSAPKNNER